MICNACKSDLSIDKTIIVFLGKKHDTPATPSCFLSKEITFLDCNGHIILEGLQVKSLLKSGFHVIRSHCLHCNEYLKGLV